MVPENVFGQIPNLSDQHNQSNRYIAPANQRRDTSRNDAAETDKISQWLTQVTILSNTILSWHYISTWLLEY